VSAHAALKRRSSTIMRAFLLGLEVDLKVSLHSHLLGLPYSVV